MKAMMVLIVAFLVVVLIFNRRRFQKDEINSVEEFHNNYRVRRENMSRKKDSGSSNYITKYNSTEDYREK